MLAVAQMILPIRNHIVILPTRNAVHGQHNWQGQHLSEMYGDHTLWGSHTITKMLQKFLDVSGTICLPDLAEYD